MSGSSILVQTSSDTELYELDYLVPGPGGLFVKKKTIAGQMYPNTIDVARVSHGVLNSVTFTVRIKTLCLCVRLNQTKPLV